MAHDDEKRHTGEHPADVDLTRARGRRQEDTIATEIAAEKASGFFAQLEALVKKATTLGFVWVLVASLIGWAGGRYVSPGEERAELQAAMVDGFHRQDSLRAALAAEWHVRDSVQSSQIQDLQVQNVAVLAQMRFNGYALCIALRQIDSRLAPPECGSMIEGFRGNRRVP